MPHLYFVNVYTPMSKESRAKYKDKPVIKFSKPFYFRADADDNIRDRTGRRWDRTREYHLSTLTFRYDPENGFELIREDKNE